MAKKKTNPRVIRVPTDDEIKAILDFADDAKEYSLPSTVRTRNQINMDIYNGKAWEVWQNYKDNWGYPLSEINEQEQSERFHLKDDLIVDAFDRYRAVLVGGVPRFIVKAMSKDSEDTIGSLLGTRILNIVWRKHDISDLQERLVKIGGLLGQAYAMPYWDAEAGDYHSDTKSFMGDIGIEILWPDEVAVDPGVTYLKESRRVLLRRIYPKSIIGRFGVDPKTLQNTNILQALPQDKTNYRYRLLDSIPTTLSKQGFVVLFDYFEKPSAQFPLGKHIVWCERKEKRKPADILWSKELPLADGNSRGPIDIPVVEFHDAKLDGSYAATTRFEGAIPCQMMYNIGLSILVEVFAKMPPETWISAQSIPSHGLDDDQKAWLSSAVAALKVYNNDPQEGAGPPKRYQGASPSPLLPSFLQMCKNRIYEHFNVTDVRGVIAQAHTKAEVELAVASDMHPLKTLYGRPFEQQMAKLMRLVLAIYRKNAKESRIMVDVQDFYHSQVVKFKGSDINFNDIDIVPGTSMSISQIEIEGHLQRAIALGVINPRTPEGRLACRNYLHSALGEYPLSPDEQQETRANAENLTMLRLVLGDKHVQETDYYVHPADKSPIHGASHLAFWISSEVQSLPLKTLGKFNERMGKHMFEHFPMEKAKYDAAKKDDNKLNMRLAWDEILDSIEKGRRTRIQDMMQQGVPPNVQAANQGVGLAENPARAALMAQQGQGGGQPPLDANALAQMLTQGQGGQQ